MELNTQENGSSRMHSFVSLFNYYSKTLRDKSTKYSVNDLFAERKANDFIRECFSEEYKVSKIKHCINIITPFRALHTVSAYLLGLNIKDRLQIDTRNWRRLPGEKSSKGSFELFWSLICLFHDIGYEYEESSEKYKSNETIDGLILYLNLEYNLLEESKYKELISKYYKKRISGKPVYLDHGIVGALLLYDALMDLAENSQIYSSIKEYKSFFVKICDTIALHNMWRASTDTIDEYKLYSLRELIPGNDQHHIIFYKDDPLLFLLAFVDTIDPIKAFCRDRRYRDPVTEISVLENTYVRFVNRTRVKKLDLSYNSPEFTSFAYKNANSESGIMSWLGVFVRNFKNSQGNETLSISINLDGSASVESKDRKL
jgi:hypothetical protein